MPRPKALHHLVEDFLTLWDGPQTHITPLRHFLDHITQHDLRSRFDQVCFFEAMTHNGSSLACSDQYLQGQGLSATKDMMDIAVDSGLVSFLASQQGTEKSSDVPGGKLASEIHQVLEENELGDVDPMTKIAEFQADAEISEF
nr:hypothetical protein BaRGS_027755 [Batillaria attramentaria]